MKTTKFLVGSLAVMSLAACQNEELIKTDNVTSTLEREQIDVTLKLSGDATSRMINNNGSFAWEATDELGACLVDVDVQGTAQNDDHIGNNLFKYNNGIFTTASTMSTGVYVFYYPYQEKNTTSRGGINIKPLDKVQKWDPTGEEMMKNNFMVSPVVYIGGYEGDKLELPMTMRSIYGYAEINITNSTSEDFEIQKVVVSNSGGFVIDGTLQPKDITDIGKYPKLFVDLVPEEEETIDFVNAFKTADDVYKDEANNGVKGGWVAAATNGTATSLSVSALNGTTGVKVAAGETTTTRMLIPAGDYSSNGLTITVYTSNGSKEFSTISNKIISCGVKEVFDLDVESVAAGNEIEAVSADDFVASLEQFKNATDNTDVTVTLLNDFEITSEMLAKVPNNVTLIFAENSDVTFSGDAEIGKVEFADGASTFVTLKGGTFTLSDGFQLGASNTLVLENAVVSYEDDFGANGATVKVTSDSELNYDKNILAHLEVDGGKLTFEAPATRATETSFTIYNLNIKDGEVVVNAPLSIANGTYSVTVGDGTANKEAVLKLNKTVTLGSGASLNVGTNGTVEYAAEGNTTITENNGTVDFTKGNLKVTTNEGIINNNTIALNGKLTVTNNGTSATNIGTINVIERSQTDVNTSNEFGKIYYVPGAYVNVDKGTAHQEYGHVILKVTEDITSTELNDMLSTDICTALELENATLTFDMALENALNVITLNNATVNVPATVGNDSFNQSVQAFTVYVYGQSQITGKGTITWNRASTDDEANKNAIVINAGATLINSATLIGFDKVIMKGIQNKKAVVENQGVIDGLNTNVETINAYNIWLGYTYK